MTQYALPALFALFVWWFSTGLIIYLDGLPKRTFKWSMLGATIVLAVSLYGLAVSSADTSVTGAYLAFASGLLAWGWQEISFYMGFVTGSRKEACPERCGGWRHFGHAIQTSIYHELAIIAGALLVVALTWGQPNQIGTWTFMVLWWMHQSAKLNVFLGVRNLNEEFLPEHLQFLSSFLTKKPMNLLFPVSVTVSTVITVWLVQKAIAPGVSDFEAAGFTFLATMMILAILEHWLLVLPLPVDSLWSWSLKSHGARKPFEVDIVAGFLGAGKTTFMRRLLADADPTVRTVALVNDFSELGVDGSLMRGQGAEVVELPNGCICCSLRKDLAAQLKEVVDSLGPERVLIEPSGVAEVAALLGVLNRPDIRALTKSLRVQTVIDTSAFIRDYGRMPGYFEVQAKLTPVFILNKVDLASPAELETVRDTLQALNPEAVLAPATFGVVEEGALAKVWADQSALAAAADPEDEEHREHSHQEEALGLQSWSAHLSKQCDPQSLRAVLESIAKGAFGEVERVKGVARAGSGWVHFDVAGGRSRIAAFAAGEREEPRVVAIGRQVDGQGLQAAFEACAAASTA